MNWNDRNPKKIIKFKEIKCTKRNEKRRGPCRNPSREERKGKREVVEVK